MSEQLKHLQELEAQLHEVNEEFARAAQPLYQTTVPNYEQREEMGRELRALQSRWESVLQRISQVLGICSAPIATREITTKEHRDENQ